MLTVNFSPFPVLTTEQLVLREITQADAPQIFDLRSDKRIMEFLDRPILQSQQEGIELTQKIIDAVQKNEGLTWGMTLKNETKLVGTIGYWKITKEHFRAEIGYMLHPDLQGRGLMQEAMTVVLDHGFNKIGLHSIEANVNPGNISSIKLLEKNHFVREAYHKENYYYNGKFLDSAIYSLLTPG
jgi:[ribosomal protein S5]-alanine N-acetyltransferase